MNPTVPAVYLRQAVTEILSPASQDAIGENRRFHEFLVHGYRGVAARQVRLDSVEPVQVTDHVEAAVMVEQIRALVAGNDWRAKLGGQKGWVKAAAGLTAWLRDPQNPGNQVLAGGVGARQCELLGET